MQNRNGASRGAAAPQAAEAGRPRGARKGDADGARSQRAEPEREILKTIAFDSVGVKKYALQIQKARNGNPCLRIVEGTPLDDGTFRKFDLRIWSEDFERFFKAIDEMRTFIKVHEVRTPQGHVWKPKPPRTDRAGSAHRA